MSVALKQTTRSNPQTQGWDQIAGLLSQIAVGADGFVWGINSAQQIYRLQRHLSQARAGRSPTSAGSRCLGAFIVEQSTNPAYADSLVSRRPPQREKPKIDPLNLSREQFEAIAAGKLTPSS
jgi:hypothetical protein